MSLFENKEEKAAWHMKRSRGIGGSEIPIILGLSPYTTPYQLWLEKTGEVLPRDIGSLPHVRRGVEGEIVCRALIEQEERAIYKPKTWEQAGTIYRCSDDGYNLDTETILEIKCQGKDAHEKAKTEGLIPEHYRIQCQWNLMVSGAKRCRFISFRPEVPERVEISCEPNPSEWPALRKAADEFWELVQSKTPPKLTDKDYIEIADIDFEEASKEYVYLKAQAAQLEDKILALSKTLKKAALNHRAVKNSHVKVLRTQRQGTVDYKRLAEDAGLDLVSYRGPSTEVTTIYIVKE